MDTFQAWNLHDNSLILSGMENQLVFPSIFRYYKILELNVVSLEQSICIVSYSNINLCNVSLELTPSMAQLRQKQMKSHDTSL